MNYFVIFLAVILYTGLWGQGTSDKAANGPSLTPLWETEGLKTPECAVYDAKRGVLYIGNINGNSPKDGYDGDGFVSKMSLDGKIMELEWVKGLSDPKGMELYQNFLYVNDKHFIVKIDVLAGKIVEMIQLPGAVFLNDIAVDKDGTVYSNDADGHQIYRFRDGKAEVFWKDPESGRPNGIWIEKDRLLLATTISKQFMAVDKTTKAVTVLKKQIGHGDGIEPVKKNTYLITDYMGRIYLYTKKGELLTLLDSRGERHTADLEYIKAKKLLVVPSHKNNTVRAFRLNK